MLFTLMVEKDSNLYSYKYHASKKVYGSERRWKRKQDRKERGRANDISEIAAP